MANNSKRTALYSEMYKAVSKATFNEQPYVGMLKSLFGDIKVSAPTITMFLWVISHKTNALPTILFNIKDHGTKGKEIRRVNSGFYLYNESERTKTHVTGIDLIPYIVQSIDERTAFLKQAKSKPKEEIPVQETPKTEPKEEQPVNQHACDLTQLSEKDLKRYGQRVEYYIQDALKKRSNYRAEILRREEERKKRKEEERRKKLLASAKEGVDKLLKEMGLTFDDLLKEDGII